MDVIDAIKKRRSIRVFLDMLFESPASADVIGVTPTAAMLCMHYPSYKGSIKFPMRLLKMVCD